MDKGTATVTLSATRKIQFIFEPPAWDRLERLQQVTEDASKADVVRNALRVYEWLADQALDGGTLTITRGGVTAEGPIDLRIIVPVRDAKRELR